MKPSTLWQDASVFHGLSDDDKHALADLLQEQQYHSGDVIIREGATGRDMYVVASGAVEVYKEDGDFVIATLEAGEYFGLMSLLDGVPRSASVRATRPTTVYALSLEELERLPETRQQAVRTAILHNHLKGQQQHLRATTERTAEALRREREHAEKREALESILTSPWYQSDLFSGLSARRLEKLAPLLKQKEVAVGEPIIHEGDSGREMYLVESGAVEVYKEDGGFVIATLEAGSNFGLMSLLDGAPRSASVRAAEPAVVSSLALEDLETLPKADRRAILDAILRNHLKDQNRHLRETTDRTVDALKKELEQARARAALGSFVTYVIVIMCVYGFVMRDAVDRLASMTFSTLITVGILAFYAVTLFFMMKNSGYPLSVYGLTLKGWKKTVAESVAWTVGFCGVIVAAKWVMIQTTDLFAGPLFAFPALEAPSVQAAVLDGLIYGLFAPVQELVARGALQGSLQQFLTGRYVKTRAVVFSTLMFTSTHLHLSVGFALLVMVPSLFWGALFAKQRSLLGVSLSHILVGWFILYILGLPGLSL